MEQIAEDCKEIEKDIDEIKCNPIKKLCSDILKCFFHFYKFVFCK